MIFLKSLYIFLSLEKYSENHFKNWGYTLLSKNPFCPLKEFGSSGVKKTHSFVEIIFSSSQSHTLELQLQKLKGLFLLKTTQNCHLLFGEIQLLADLALHLYKNMWSKFWTYRLEELVVEVKNNIFLSSPRISDDFNHRLCEIFELWIFN